VRSSTPAQHISGRHPRRDRHLATLEQRLACVYRRHDPDRRELAQVHLHALLWRDERRQRCGWAE
jgi:hypothetical protein